MLCDRRLVGGHHMLAVCQSRLDKRAGNPLFAADQLHHQVNVRRGRHVHAVVKPAIAGQINAAILILGAGGNTGDFD